MDLDELKSAIDGHHGATLAALKKQNDDIAAARADFATLDDRLAEIESRQRSPGATGGGTKQIVNPITEVCSAPQIKQVAEGAVRESGAIKLPPLREMLRSLKSLTSLQDSPNSPQSGYSVQPQRLDEFHYPTLGLSLLEVLPVIPATSNGFEFPVFGDSFDPTAAIQAGEGVKKQELSAAVTMTTAPIVTIAHFFHASRQILSDVPAMQVQLGNLLRYGAMKKAEYELINGSGSGRNITGLITSATGYAPSPMTGAPADRIGRAMTEMRVAGWDPSLVILHPTDWQNMASERASGGNEQYIAAGGWSAPVTSGIWGAAKVVTPSIAQGTALIVDRSQVALLDRQQATLIVSVLGYTDLTANMCTLLVDLRIGLATFSPGARRTVDLT